MFGRKIAAAVSVLAFGAVAVGGGVASADQSTRTYRGGWTTVTDVCGPAVLTEPGVPTPVPASGTWSLRLKRDGTGTFVFDFRDIRGTVVAGTVPASVLTKHPLTFTATYPSPFIGDFTMNSTIVDHDIVTAATSLVPCDEAGHVLSPVFTGTVR
jgi:hypothetical protein